MAKNTRSSLSILIVSTFLVIILLRLAYLQIYKGREFALISENNFVKEVVKSAPRGSILDRFNRKIAYSKPVINLYFKFNRNENKNDIKSFVLGNLGINKPKIDRIFTAAEKRPNRRMLIARELNLDQIYRIENNSRQFNSLELVVDYLRVYPYSEVGSHKIGYLKANDKRDLIYGTLLSTRLGATGLEKIYEDTLSGKSGSSYILVDSRGNEVAVDSVIYEKQDGKAIPGEDLSLTVDIELEKLIFESFGKLNGAGMVHDIDTGEILALVSKPSYDPNLFSQEISKKDWIKLRKNKAKPFLDRALFSSNPPGSIVKIITAIAGLEEAVVTSETEHYCPGSYLVGKRKFRCWKRGGHGNINVSEALTSSCDVFFYKVGLALGVNKFASWLARFGYGEKIEFPFQQNLGVIPDKAFIKKVLKDNFYPGDMANVAIGQGYITINTLQASLMTSIIASNGTKPNFSIVKQTRNKVTESIKINKRNLRIVQQGLLGVVNDSGGTGFHARGDGKLAGKTGTAQVISKDSRDYGYGKYKNHGWFTSYYPYDKPKIVISVFVEHGDSGGRAGGPIIKKVVNYYKANYMTNE